MRLQRTSTGRNGDPTFGLLVSKDGKFTCVTLERSADGPHPRIPAGTYRVYFDQHHPGTAGAYRCPELDTSAIGRSQVQIHVLNRVEQSLGCIGPGENIAADGESIEHSKSAFDRLMIYLEGVTEFMLDVVDP